MTGRDRTLALTVVLVWGLQFAATRVALDQFPPFLLGALRFTLIAIPTVMFVRRPRVRLRWLVGYGLSLGVVEFALLYLAIWLGMSSGLASLVIQSAAPFTVVLAAWWLRERPTMAQWAGLLAAVGGLTAIAVHREPGTTFLPIALTLLAGLAWAVANICARQARPRNALQFTVWTAVVPPIPMFALSLGLEGPDVVGHALRTAVSPTALPATAALLYIAVVCTIVGNGLWSLLLKRYPASTIAPVSLLVPVLAMIAGAVLLDESVSTEAVIEGLVVLAGVLVVSRSRPGPAPSKSQGAEADRDQLAAGVSG